ncbi:unnamed protein product [Porites evermanni]|uniref:receptor protein-tyrosine kinase n=1 Tax=Porites evermanni TaxID=104178 RepID=A0ABN8R4X1_9CNID|nr:unnamed protein product [Porites evermanni]
MFRKKSFGPLLTTMNGYLWTFILWITTAVYQANGETEIVLKQPIDGVLWSWHTTRMSNGGAGWNLAPSQRAYSVCDITIKSQPTNWLRSDFIDVKDAKMLNVELKYNLLGCPTSKSSVCNHELSIYVLHVEKELVGVDLNPLTAKETYQKVETIVPKVLPPPKELKEYDYDSKIITEKGGVYLAFLDRGACVSLSRVIVSYNYCSEIGSVLVRFSRTAAPVNDSYLEEQTGRCTDVNSINKVKLSGVCLSSGEWNITDGIKCLCKPGYQLVNGSDENVLECSECLKGFYKSVANNSKCDKCPATSASNTGRTGCLCNDGFYKKSELAPCKALPAAPLYANATLVKATYVVIKWKRSTDDSGGKLRYAVDCFKCESSNYKDCKEPCGARVQYMPSQDNITSVTVTINGLPPDSFLKFRVYSVSELNEEEKDRDKWKYVMVSVKTKGDSSPLSKEVRMVLYIAVPIVVLIIVALIVFVVCMRRRDRILKGYGRPGDSEQIELPSHGQRLYIDPCNYEDPEEALKEFAKELDKKWITLEKVIGGGEFGDVYQGTLTRPDEEPILVAVKTLKAGAATKNRKDFIFEASIMGQFCDPNVIYLEGVVTKTLPLMIVIEFMANGSLDNFLKKMDGKLTIQQLLGMARGVASGMKFLSEMNFVHRDLAARNVLVSETMVCKVADFGLSRELEDAAYETKGGKIPVRWTALEAIEYRKFTAASDVWSYGVLLWEIMSFAERPYWDWTNFEVMDRVKGGYRLPPPLGCPKTIHQIMLNCWNADRSKRPKFVDIVKRLDVLIRSPDRLNEDPTPEPKSPKLEYTDFTTIKDWLESIKMGQYNEMFSKAGFTHLQQVASEDELDLSGMGIKLIGHKNKIHKSLKEVKKTLSKDTAF